jgi:hypothetical protein
MSELNHVNETVLAFEDLGRFDPADPVYQNALACVCDAFTGKPEPSLADLLVVLSLARSLVIDGDPMGGVRIIDTVCSKVETFKG